MKSHNVADNTEPHVTVFGERVSDRKKCCRHGRGGSVGGLLILLIGIMLLLNIFDIVTWEFWNQIVIFWPVLLILGGLNLILGDSVVSRLISFIIALIVFGFVIAFGLKGIESPYYEFLSPFYSEAIDFVNE